MPDAHKNFAYSTLTNSPGTTGTTFNVADGSVFPVAPFNATVWPTATQPTSANAEIVRVTVVAGNVLTVSARGPGTTQEGSTNQNVASGFQIAATVTAKTITDIEDNYVNSWSPYIPTSGGTAIQSYNSNTSANTGSLFLFPITAQFPVKFNQIILPIQLSYLTSATAQTISNTYYSYFGLYSMQPSNTMFGLISSNSFSIAETLGSVSVTWNYPTTTATSGYGYGSFPAGNLTTTAQMSSFISGTRAIGLQFGGEMSISGGQYWLGLLHLRSSAVSGNRGLSVVGIAGQIINPINMAGTVSGARPIGEAPSEWAITNTNVSGWFGRQLIGFLTATTTPSFLGTGIPNAFALHRLGAPTAASMGTILPTVTFCST